MFIFLLYSCILPVWQICYVYDKCFIVVLPFFTGVAQGIITGIRGLCNGLGPALFGFIFYLFHVDLNETSDTQSDVHSSENNTYHQISSAIQVHKFQLDFMFWMIYFYVFWALLHIYFNILLRSPCVNIWQIWNIYMWYFILGILIVIDILIGYFIIYTT